MLKLGLYKQVINKELDETICNISETDCFTEHQKFFLKYVADIMAYITSGCDVKNSNRVTLSKKTNL